MRSMFLYVPVLASLLPSAVGFGKVDELHDFGKAMATGLCKLPGLPPIVSFPKWGEALTPDQPDGAVYVIADGQLIPFNGLPKKSFGSNLKCVQSLFCPQDESRVMYLLDSGHSPAGTNLPEGSAKLLQIKLDDDGRGGTLKQSYVFPHATVPAGGYLNDVRVDGKGFAYMTDSNSGTIVILDLESKISQVWKDARMDIFLAKDEKFMIGSKDLSGLPAKVDGIAYSKDDDMLYWKPVVRSNMFRISAEHLRSAFRAEQVCRQQKGSCVGGFESLVNLVQDVGKFGFHDGIDADSDGSVFLTDLSRGAIQRRTKHGLEALISEEGSLDWPDATIASGDQVFVLTTQVHLMPFMNEGKDLRTGGNKLYRITLPEEDLRRPKATSAGRLQDALSGKSGFPSAMPAIPKLSIPEPCFVDSNPRCSC